METKEPISSPPPEPSDSPSSDTPSLPYSFPNTLVTHPVMIAQACHVFAPFSTLLHLLNFFVLFLSLIS